MRVAAAVGTTGAGWRRASIVCGRPARRGGDDWKQLADLRAPALRALGLGGARHQQLRFLPTLLACIFV